MSILQLKASESIIQGQDFYRFKTQIDGLIGPAEETEIGTAMALDISTKAITIGPDSSFDRYAVYYYNPATNISANVGFVSVNRPWIGRLDAFANLGESKDSRARLYVVAANNIALGEINGQVQLGGAFFAPVFDIIAYTTDRLTNLSTAGRAPEFIDTAVLIDFPGIFSSISLYFPFFGRGAFDLDLYAIDPAVKGAFPLVTSYDINGVYTGDLSGELQRVPLGLSGAVDLTREHYEVSPTSKGKFEFIELRFLRNGGPQTVNVPEDHDHGGVRVAFNAY